MNIRQVEAETGLTRANIRFYESRGLIAPGREGNGYRNYTDDHVETLKRIKLLRRLGISLEEIERLQKDEESLSQTLAARIREAEGEEQKLREQQRICRKMREDGVVYRSLNADFYLSEFGRAQAGPAKKDPVEDDQEVRQPGSLRRFFARQLDFMLCGLLFDCFCYLVIRMMPMREQWFQVVSVAATLLLMYLLEPVFLHFFGATPGKLLLGIRVYHEDGGRLTMEAARERTGKVLFYGLGLSIPVFHLYRLWKSFRANQDGETLPWDDQSVTETGELKTWQVIASVSTVAAVIAVTFLLLVYAMYPIHRGDVTAAELAENINRYLDYYDLYLDRRLDAECRWQELPSSAGSFVITFSEMPDPVLELTVTDGAVREISFHARSTTAEWGHGYPYLVMVLMRAYGGTRPGLDIRRFSRMDKLIADHPLQSYSETIDGIQIDYAIDYQGYLATSDGNLFADEAAKERYIDVSFTMRIPDAG